MAYFVLFISFMVLWSILTGFVPGFSGGQLVTVFVFFLFTLLWSGYIILKRFFPRLFMRSRR